MHGLSLISRPRRNPGPVEKSSSLAIIGHFVPRIIHDTHHYFSFFFGRSWLVCPHFYNKSLAIELGQP